MCFVRTWNTKLASKAPALTLSHHRIGLEVQGKPTSVRSCCSHTISIEAKTNAIYSDYVLDLATVACFLEAHETMLFPTNTQCAATDFLSSRLEAQLVSK